MTDNRPLEAPDCPLCHPAGEDVLWQDERLRVIHVGTEAGQPAYFRVIWQQHLPEMTDLSDADRLYLWRVLSVLAPSFPARQGESGQFWQPGAASALAHHRSLAVRPTVSGIGLVAGLAPG